MQKAGSLVIVAMVLTATVAGCAEAELRTVEVTREVKVPQTVEVTREVTRVVEEVVRETVEVVVRASPTPTPAATATSARTMEDYQSDLGQAIVNDLEAVRDVERVNLVRWEEGLLLIELQTVWASRDRQPDVSWNVVTLLAEPFAETSEGQRMSLTGSRELTIKLTTYSADGDYRYRSDTDFATLVKIENRSISYEEWVQAASAGFR